MKRNLVFSALKIIILPGFWPNVSMFEVLFVCIQDWFAVFSLQYTNIQHRLKLNSRPALALPQAAIAEILMYWMQSNFQLASAAPEVEPWRLNNCCFLYSFVTIYESRKEQKKKKKISLHSLGQTGDMRVLLEWNSGLKIFQLQRRKARKKRNFHKVVSRSPQPCRMCRHWSYHSSKVHLRRRKMTAWVQGPVSLKSSIDIFPQLTPNLWHISGDLKRKGFLR